MVESGSMSVAWRGSSPAGSRWMLRAGTLTYSAHAPSWVMPMVRQSAQRLPRPLAHQ